ncbi:MAG: hypothetical protein U0234_02280 [Sandaracinus sp.]
MSDLLGITLEQMISGLKARRTRIPAEIGAYVALEVAEHLMRGPARVTPADIKIGDDGLVSVFVTPNTADEDAAAQSVVEILASTLVAAGTGVPSVLIQLVEETPPSGPGCLAMLTSELESSLVPLNRAAARRVLSRMTRDAKRPRTEAPPGGPGALDDALDDLLNPPSTQGIPLDMPPKHVLREALKAPSIPPEALAPPVSDDVETIAEEPPADEPSHDDTQHDEAPTGKVEKQLPVPATPTARPAARAAAAAPEPAAAKPAPAPATKPRKVELDDFERAGAEPDRPSGGSGALGFVLAFLVVVLAFGAVIAWLRPDLVDEALGRPPPPSGPTPEERAAEQERILAEHRAHFGTLTVTSEPTGAQVLLYVGRGPAVARDLPTGAAYELVAFADGHGASRAIVPADAQWETTDEGTRYELALQTSDEEVDLAHLALGETRLPRDALGTPSGTLGTVRVVTNPPGARVYLLIGFTPDVRYENIRTDEPVELLVYAEGYEVERTMVGPSDWQDTPDGTKAANVNVTLHELAPPPRRGH